MGRQGTGAPEQPGVRQAIVGAARRLLEERGVEEAVTLRAVARGADISAPSIYHHFADLAAVLEAVIGEAFTEYGAATVQATAGIDDPLERLRAGAHAYIRFAREQPATYRIMFARPRPSPLPVVAQHAATTHQATIDAIELCTRHGRPPGADATVDAALLWAALHGLADLPTAHPRFPWPAEHELVDGLLRRLVLRERDGPDPEGSPD